MKKLSAACMILGLSLFVGGCSNDQINGHIISLQDKFQMPHLQIPPPGKHRILPWKNGFIWMKLPAHCRILTAQI